MIVHIIITAFLLILKGKFPCLPSHEKNLAKTRSQFTVKSFYPEDPSDNSVFVYTGLARQLQRIVNSKNHAEKKLKLQFNLDGLPLFRSGGSEFWPILVI